MEYEESLTVLSTIARRIQVAEKLLHDLYWDIDQLVQKQMNDEIQKQKNAEKTKAPKVEVKSIEAPKTSKPKVVN